MGSIAVDCSDVLFWSSLAGRASDWGTIPASASWVAATKRRQGLTVRFGPGIVVRT